ncbi:MAG TPA: PAS domain S-box protein, partial [Bacteroidota bacterium]
MQALRIVEPPGYFETLPTRPAAVQTRNRGTLLFRSTTSLLQSVWENSTDGMVVTDHEGIIVAVNKAFCSLVSMGEYQLLGRSFTVVGNENRGHDEAQRVYQEQFTKRSVAKYFERCLTLGNGQEIDVEIANSFVEGEDGVVLLLGVYRNATRRKQAERALARNEKNFRELFDNSVQGMFQTGFDGKLINANPSLLRLLGYSSVEELQRVDIGAEIYANPRDRERLIELLLQHGFCRDVELQLKRKDGKRITVLEHSRVIRDDQGNPVMFEGIMEDITDRKEQEQQLRVSVDALRVSEESLAESNARKDKLLAALSHDIRSPLGSILGFCDLLMQESEKLSKQESKQFLSYIRDAAQSQLQLINELLDKPREKPSKGESRQRTTDLSTVGERTLQLLQPVAKQKGATLVTEIPVQTMISGDSQLVLQLFNNLVSNALKFTPSGGTITLALTSQTNNAVTVAVRDTGIGIATEDMKLLFTDSGARSRTGLSGEKGGGLGLRLCSDIMRELGGEITVNSEVGKGTTFFLHFAKLESDTAADVLVVDDEPGVRALHAKYIARVLPNARILQAENGQKALEMMFRHKPKIVFSDFAMP